MSAASRRTVSMRRSNAQPVYSQSPSVTQNPMARAARRDRRSKFGVKRNLTIFSDLPVRPYTVLTVFTLPRGSVRISTVRTASVPSGPDARRSFTHTWGDLSAGPPFFRNQYFRDVHPGFRIGSPHGSPHAG